MDPAPQALPKTVLMTRVTRAQTHDCWTVNVGGESCRDEPVDGVDDHLQVGNSMVGAPFQLEMNIPHVMKKNKEGSR